jgi:hypothetical protein
MVNLDMSNQSSLRGFYDTAETMTNTERDGVIRRLNHMNMLEEHGIAKLSWVNGDGVKSEYPKYGISLATPNDGIPDDVGLESDSAHDPSLTKEQLDRELDVMVQCIKMCHSCKSNKR